MSDDYKPGVEDEWDRRVPQSVADVIALLRRRILIHQRWRDWLATGPNEAKDAARLGGGTVESHERYIAQYQGAIDVLTTETVVQAATEPADTIGECAGHG